MTDIMSESVLDPSSLGQSLVPKLAGSDGKVAEGEKADLVAWIELFYFAYRDFTCEPDTLLAQYGFGRAHHRVLHFVQRNPGLNVANLLEILKITKQSLARVLKQLVDEGFIIQRAGDVDRRERRLFVSAKGGRLTDKLTRMQVKRFELALSKAGPGADALTRRFLFAMITEKDRSHVEALLQGAAKSQGVPVE